MICQFASPAVRSFPLFNESLVAMCKEVLEVHVPEAPVPFCVQAEATVTVTTGVFGFEHSFHVCPQCLVRVLGPVLDLLSDERILNGMGR